ncbi:hypothetical protein I6F07_32045 [Ensifer sp. IC4062]|nr:hypothetical protein [Ensifer sp. IC4062]
MASAVSGAAGAQTAAPDVGSNNQLFQDRAMLRSSETSKLIFWIRAMIGDCFPATPSSNRFARRAVSGTLLPNAFAQFLDCCSIRRHSYRCQDCIG